MNNPVKFEAQKIRNFQKIKFKGKINNKNLIYLYGLSDNGEPGFNIIKEVDIIIICLPTPIRSNKAPDLDDIKNCLLNLKKYIKKENN